MCHVNDIEGNDISHECISFSNITTKCAKLISHIWKFDQDTKLTRNKNTINQFTLFYKIQNVSGTPGLPVTTFVGKKQQNAPVIRCKPGLHISIYSSTHTQSKIEQILSNPLGSRY